MVVEDAGEYAIRRAIGVGVNTRPLEGAPIIATIRAEAIALGADLASRLGVDLWILTGKHVKRLTKHRSHRPPPR